MWRFTGDISFTCEGCGDEYAVPIGDFDHDANSYERGMGPENIHNLLHELDCDSCGKRLHVEFDVSEYPLGMVNFTTDRHEGISDCSEPASEHYPEIYTIGDAFEHRSGDIAELIRILECEPKFIKSVGRFEFENVVAEIFRKQGCRVEQTKRTRDGGKDIIVFSVDGMGIENKYFIECKHPDEGNKVGVSLVREAYGVHNTKDGPNKTILVTTSTFTKDAKQFADNDVRSRWEFDLKDYDDIVEWLRTTKH